MTCSVISVFELLGGCRDLREQRATLRSLTTVEIVQIEAEILVRRYSGIGPTIFPEASVFLTVLWQPPPGRSDCQIHTRNTKHFRAIPGLRVMRPY